MKKFFILLGLLLLAAGVVAVLWAMFNEEKFMAILQKFSLTLTAVVGTLVVQKAVSMAEKDAFGGWTVKISVDDKVLEFETQPLEVEDAEKIIEYNRDLWLVFFIGGHPKLRKILETEKLLRRCCDSQGWIMGNPKDSTVLDGVNRVILIQLSKDQIVRSPKQ